MKRIVFAILYSMYIIGTEIDNPKPPTNNYSYDTIKKYILSQIKSQPMKNAFIDMISTITEKDFTSLIMQKKYESITIESILKIFTYLDILLFFNQYIQTMFEQQRFAFNDYLINQKKAFRNALTNVMLNVLENPNEKEEPIFQLLPLVTGPGVTLLEITRFDTFQKTQKESIENKYNKLLNGCFNIIEGEQAANLTTFFQSKITKAQNVNSEINQVYIEEAAVIASNILNTMSKHQISNNTNKTIDLNIYSTSILQDHEKLLQNLNKTLQKTIASVAAKTDTLKKSKQSYKIFLYDYSFHANLLGIIRLALTTFKDIQQSPNNTIFTRLLTTLTSYFDAIIDTPALDGLEERNLILHYKTYLINSVNELLKNYENVVQQHFNPAKGITARFSSNRINSIAQYINNWFYHNVPMNKGDKITDLSPSKGRTLLFYADLIEQVYSPHDDQWQRLSRHGNNTFRFWQQQIASIYNLYVLNVFQNINSPKNRKTPKVKALILNYTFYFTDKTWDQYIKQNSDRVSADLLLKEQEETMNWLPLIDLQSDTKKLISTIKKQCSKFNLMRWNLIFVRFINNKDALDLVTGRAVKDILALLNQCIDTICEYQFDVTDKTLTHNLLGLLTAINNMKTALVNYLKTVLYKQKPSPLYEAYIKTGKALVRAIEKTAAKIEEKTKQKQELSELSEISEDISRKENKPITDKPDTDTFKSLDAQFDQRKSFLYT